MQTKTPIKKIRILFISFILVLCFGLGYYTAYRQGRTDVQHERERAAQITEDLRQAREVERAATRRAEQLQKELERATARINQLQSRADGFISTTRTIQSGIDGAISRASESQRLINESTNILRSIQNRGPTKN